MAYPDEPYEFALAANRGSMPYVWSVVDGSLPAGLELDPDTGVISGTIISGTVTTPVTTNFTIEATDTAQFSDSREFSLAVVDRLEIVTSGELPPAVLGQPYSLMLTAAGGESPYGWSLVGDEFYEQSDPQAGYLGGGTPMD